MRISDWSSDVCSSDLTRKVDVEAFLEQRLPHRRALFEIGHDDRDDRRLRLLGAEREAEVPQPLVQRLRIFPQMRPLVRPVHQLARSEEHTSELQSLMRISYAVFCSKKKNPVTKTNIVYHLMT